VRRIEKLILQNIKKEKYILTIHARIRMNERHITDADIVEVAYTLKSIRRQDHNNTYLLTGLNTWGEVLVLSVAIREKVIIVTVFFKE
jgi:hypothetical protein